MLPAPSEVAHCVFVVGLVVVLTYGPAITSCLNRSFSPINWLLSRHCLVSCVCLLFVCAVFVLVFGVVCAFASSCFVFDERDSTLDYVSVLYQFTFAAIAASAFA